MMTSASSFIASLGSASRDQAGGALTSAAVPRVGLGPTTPPLCRCGERTTDLILHAWRVRHRKVPGFTPHYKVVSVSEPRTYPIRSPGAWCVQRSGVKEEAEGRGTAAELYTPSARAGTVR